MLGIPFALLLLLVLAVAPAYAQGAQGCLTNVSNPANAFGMNSWQTLCGQPAIFSFNYSGDNDPARLEMATMPQNAANFYMFTQTEFNKGINQTDILNGGGDTNNARFVDTLAVPFGSGTQTTIKTSDGSTAFLNNGNLTWTGGTTFSGTYYVVVRPTTNQPVSFWINPTGSGISNFHYVSSVGTSQQPMQQLAMATTGTNLGASQAPRLLPRTGGEFEAMQLLAAGAALVAGGWFLRRRKQ